MEIFNAAYKDDAVNWYKDHSASSQYSEKSERSKQRMVSWARSECEPSPKKNRFFSLSKKLTSFAEESQFFVWTVVFSRSGFIRNNMLKTCLDTSSLEPFRLPALKKINISGGLDELTNFVRSCFSCNRMERICLNCPRLDVWNAIQKLRLISNNIDEFLAYGYLINPISWWWSSLWF